MRRIGGGEDVRADSLRAGILAKSGSCAWRGTKMAAGARGRVCDGSWEARATGVDGLQHAPCNAGFFDDGQQGCAATR
jgi:hypothetical protein